MDEDLGRRPAVLLRLRRRRRTPAWPAAARWLQRRDSARMTQRVWLLTGASRGFGLEIARKILSQGDRVVATARRAGQIAAALPDAGDRLLAVDLDVTDGDQAQAAVRAG